jgi:hypothetical protein
VVKCNFFSFPCLYPAGDYPWWFLSRWLEFIRWIYQLDLSQYDYLEFSLCSSCHKLGPSSLRWVRNGPFRKVFSLNARNPSLVVFLKLSWCSGREKPAPSCASEMPRFEWLPVCVEGGVGWMENTAHSTSHVPWIVGIVWCEVKHWKSDLWL